MTFLRWAGSKKQIRETLSHCWHAAQTAGGNGRYIEAFCGSASLFFHIKPSSALLVDINAELMDCYEVVREDPAAVVELLQQYPVDQEFYYQLRAADELVLDPVERAARFIYLNRFCFNGLYRTNANGRFNVPYGAGRTGAVPSLEVLREASETLSNSELIHCDFELALSGEIKQGDFIYVDPPYAKRNHSLDFQYGPDEFGVGDLNRLFDLLEMAHDAGAFFVLSYADCDDVEEFSEKWGGYTVEVQRSIAADTSCRERTREVLISNL